MSLTAACQSRGTALKIHPAIAPRRPKLAEGLWNAQSALCDELFQGRASHILFGRLAATTMDSSLIVETGIGIDEQDLFWSCATARVSHQSRICSSSVSATRPGAETNSVRRSRKGTEIARHLGFSMAMVNVSGICSSLLQLLSRRATLRTCCAN